MEITRVDGRQRESKRFPLKGEGGEEEEISKEGISS